jgi:hypothetical protein
MADFQYTEVGLGSYRRCRDLSLERIEEQSKEPNVELYEAMDLDMRRN